VIQPGDVLDVSMVTDYTKLTATTTAVRVADDGTVVIPLVGKVGVAGMKVEEAEQAVNAQSIMQGVFHNPCITVTMKQCRTHTVTVVGAVNKPGVRELPRGATSLMAALVAAKGLSKDAGTMVQIRHTDQRQGAINRLPAPQATDGVDPSATLASYQQSSSATATPAIATTTVDIAAAAGTIKVPELHDGDVVYVTKRTLRPIHVIGLVSKPGEFPYPTSREIRVLDALALAGGVSNPVAEDVVVIRQMPGAPEPARIVVSIQAAKNGRDNVALAPGDTVTVEQTPVTIVVDAIRTFFHFGVGTNMSWF
jgi:polysaccharide export outer membrane protein